MSEALKAPVKRRASSATKPKGKAAGKKTAASARKPSAKKSARPVHAAPKKGAARKATPTKKPAPQRTGAGKTAAKKTARSASARNVSLSPVALEANRRNKPQRRAPQGDLFMENDNRRTSADAAARRDSDARRPANRVKSKGSASGKKGGGKRPPKKGGAAFGALNLCLALGIALLAILAVRQQSAYAEFQRMREVVDQQTFYEGTTVEGVDVSNMTLSAALEMWRDRVEARNENRTVTFDDGTAVTARELGYTSDYESVLSAAWSAGRSGSLEDRYLMAANRMENPVAYQITRSDTGAKALNAYVQQLAEQIDRPAQEASIASFDTETYAFQFNEAVVGRELDQEALKREIVEAIQNGGGNVNLPIATIQPQVTTDEVASQYGLIDYAITNASSSSKARLNNIKLAMSFINGVCVAPGETFSFNDTVGQRTGSRGFKLATAYSGGDVTEQVGGGICQVSTTLFNAAVKADMEIVERHNHSLTVHYVDKGKDATVDWGNQDFRFKNTSSDNIYICCYLTDDKRVRFGIFGKLLPNGEKITLEATTTEVIKAETEYMASSFLAKGQTYVLQEGRDGYKAEAYKVRWDAAGNQISKELLCKSTYRKKNEIIQYGT